MKRYCKNVDITNRDFIKSAILDCLNGGRNKRSKLSRRDTLKMFEEYSGVPFEMLKKIAKDKQYHMFDGIIETIVDGIQQEIINQKYSWKPIWYTWRKENEKLRRIGIQDIKQQLYDYIAVKGLQELFEKTLGYYQCAALPGKGQVFGMKAIRKWLKNKNMRYAWKGDAEHYYENIDRNILKELLEKHVKNEPLLHLTFALIDSFEKGLGIGSYLSQYLANFYMSFAYHFASENLFKMRRGKRKNLICHVLFYMDDILFIATCKRDLVVAVKRFSTWMWEKLHIKIKEKCEWIQLDKGYIDMMGFCISRIKVIARSRIFIRYRREIQKVRKSKSIYLKQAMRILSRDGWLKNANCLYWRKKNKADQIVGICKEMVSNGKNAIQLSAGTGHYYAVA